MQIGPAVFSYVADKEINKERNRSKTKPRPPTGGGVLQYKNQAVTPNTTDKNTGKNGS